MADNNKIRVDELEFEGIKNNLKNFLRGQKQFKDYDFDGSNLSILVDVLAYNTYYNSIYNNLALNEIFIDSASKRNSVVSIAKQLGYTPKSTRSAKAYVTLTVIYPNTEEVADQLVLPKHTPFTSVINETTYYFINLDERIATKDASGKFVFDNLEIVEGRPSTEKYIVEPGVKMRINNQFCDTSTLRVYVNDSALTGDPVIFSQADGITGVGPTANIYFLKEIDDGLYEITFGDGSVGVKPKNGNLVTFEYIISSGPDANNCKTFKPDLGVIGQGATVRIATVSSAIGGAEAEGIESIRFNAPRSNVTQNRAVTEGDYQNIIFSNFDNAKSISVWGGEDNNPKVYGKVFICVRPKTSLYLTDDEKLLLKNSVLKPKSIITSYPEIVDPEYLNIQINTTFYYNPANTTRSVASIIDIVKSTISSYAASDLQKFNGTFRQSKIARLIDGCEKSILSNVTTILLRKEVEPKYNSNAQYYLDIGNPIYTEGVPEDSVISTGFYLPDGGTTVYYLRDDGVGNMVLYYKDGFQEVVVNRTIGTVNYTKGVISINGLQISAIADTAFEFIIKPESYDAVGVRNQILEIPTSMITVKALVDTVATGRGTTSYVHTSSRS